MGEASRRKAEIGRRVQDWMDSLSADERTVAKVALVAHKAIVGELRMTEGCYNLAFFLHEYLRLEHRVKVDVVIGWVNDGEWEGGTSHAWIEFAGKKTDISLTRTSYPEHVPTGALIILDYVVAPGQAQYSYWYELPESARLELETMRQRSSEEAAIMAHKEAQHRQMQAFAAADDGPMNYLRGAPPHVGYERLARVVGDALGGSPRLFR